VLDLCGRASNRGWQTTCAAEGWPVGTVIHHLAAGNQVICDWIRVLARGQDIATSGEEVDRMNAAHATDYAYSDRLETMRLLEAEREAGIRLLNSLTDAELAREGLFKVPDQRGRPNRWHGQWSARSVLTSAISNQPCQTTRPRSDSRRPPSVPASNANGG
jgi:hypothetical protein